MKELTISTTQLTNSPSNFTIINGDFDEPSHSTNELIPMAFRLEYGM